MFVPHSDIDLKKIFNELSITSLTDLFRHLPKELIFLPEYLVIQSFTISFLVFIYTNLLHFH